MISERAAGRIRPYLDALEKKVTALFQHSEAVKEQFAENSFERYMGLRNMVAECKGLMILIEERLNKAEEEGEDVTELRQQLALLTTQFWETLLSTALYFFRQISNTPQLPLGSRDVFVRELQTLHDARHLLNRPPYSEQVSDSTLQNLDTAERILQEIIERAPGLLELE